MFVRDITCVAAFQVYCHRDVLAKKQHVILVTDCVSCRDTLCYLGLHFHALGTTSRFLPRCWSIYFGHLGFQGAVDVFVTGGSFQVQQSGLPMSNNILPCSPIYPQNTIPHTPSQGNVFILFKTLFNAFFHIVQPCDFMIYIL